MKTLLLTVLVMTSVLLSLGIWSSTPQYEAVDGPQFASNVITDPSYQRKLGEITAPRSLILHLGDEKHTAVFPGQSAYVQGIDLLAQASFFDLQVEGNFGQEQWWKVIGAGRSLEVDFGTDMPASILDGAGLLKFTSSFDPTMQAKTLYLYKGNAAEQDLRALFYASSDRKMYSARVVLSQERYNQLFHAVEGATPYKMFGQSLFKHFYLPEGRMNIPQYAVEMNETPQIKGFIEAFFVDQSLIRTVEVRDGSEILTDGIRLVERKDSIIKYSNIAPGSKMARKTEEDVGIGKALAFVNEHGGLNLQPVVLFEPPASLSGKTDDRTYQLRPYVGGIPLIDPLASVSVNVLDNEVAKMHRSELLIGNKPYKGKEQQKLLSGSELLARVQQSAFDRNKITDAYLAYLLDQAHDDYANLRPVWVIEQQGEWGGGIFDAVSGVELHDKEVMLDGLE